MMLTMRLNRHHNRLMRGTTHLWVTSEQRGEENNTKSKRTLEGKERTGERSRSKEQCSYPKSHAKQQMKAP